MTRTIIEDIVRELIHHGRHFSKTRDVVVERKCVDHIMMLLDNEIGGLRTVNKIMADIIEKYGIEEGLKALHEQKPQSPVK